MKVINISEANQEQIFHILAGILHIGNINFSETSSFHAAIQNEKCNF
jgi:myosin heavy subunit